MRTVYTMLRVPNLLIIGLTFLILRYFVFIPVFSAYDIISGSGSLNFILLVTATILIAVSGYMSNDYFDAVADQVNKPEKKYIDNQLTAGSALAIAILFGLLSIALTGWLAWRVKSIAITTMLLTALGVAWWYAVKLKKSFVWGNLAVACMTAGTIVMAWIVEIQCTKMASEVSVIITGIVVAIGMFAWLLSVMREIIKDIEDIDGDKLIGCRSLPIVKGIPYTRSVVLFLTTLLFIFMILAQISLNQYGKLTATVWLSVAVEAPLGYFVYALRKASSKSEYHKLSSLLKWIMIGGIASIVAAQL